MFNLHPNSEWLSPRFELENSEFDEVEIQLNSWCNRSCVFCPSGKFPVPKIPMSMATVERIISELEPIDFAGTIGLHLMNEPLLHKRFAEVVELFRRRLPKVDIRIESNGDAIKDFSTLWNYFAAGLNEILINCYDSIEQFEERNRAILRLQRRHPAIWYWNKWLSFPPEPKNRWKVVRLRSFYETGYTLRNWAGHVPLQRSEPLSFPLRLSCARPFRRVHVNYLGQVVLCNNDWKFEVVMGDLNNQPLQEIWNSSRFLHYRRSLLAKDRRNPLCESCDNGVPMTKPPVCPPADSLSVLRHTWLRGKNRVARGLRRALPRSQARTATI